MIFFKKHKGGHGFFAKNRKNKKTPLKNPVKIFKKSRFLRKIFEKLRKNCEKISKVFYRKNLRKKSGQIPAGGKAKTHILRY